MHLIESAGIYGAESVILNLSREMQADGRFVPVVGCIVQKADEHTDLVDVAATYGIEAHRIRISNKLVPFDLLLAAKRLRALRIDAIHCHGYKPGVFAYLIGKLTGIEVVATCHLWFMDSYAPWKMRVMISIEKRLYSRYKAVVAVSDQIQRILLENGVRPERTRVIKNGIVLADYESERHSEAPRDSIRVLNVARLAEQKAQTDLIAAAGVLASRKVNTEILIVGEGELRPALEKQIADQGSGSSVRLLGFRDDVRKLLSDSDIFVLASLDEGMPISLLEAVASRVPVIVTPVGDIPKLISDGESGIVVEPKEPAMLAAAIQRLAMDAQLRRTLAERAWHRLQQTFSSRQMFEGYAEVYEGLLRNRPAGPLAS
ncbi:glycosyltransferase involved in cell wall biosynthesis [Povalibacter uvarum]|uniref:Glycosyltransferase involved in cell wall biosynthesis n=2 Tax=Povalibacter uvarum TaxID=732238 RepID=A0A841HH75_9GAMM|nr:glycosyltransferase involved in cell wall biosynthesis [Povalibacter uvarum]